MHKGQCGRHFGVAHNITTTGRGWSQNFVWKDLCLAVLIIQSPEMTKTLHNNYAYAILYSCDKTLRSSAMSRHHFAVSKPVNVIHFRMPISHHYFFAGEEGIPWDHPGSSLYLLGVHHNPAGGAPHSRRGRTYVMTHIII